MVLELLIYAKSAMKIFDQSEASIVVMWLSKEEDLGNRKEDLGDRRWKMYFE